MHLEISILYKNEEKFNPKSPFFYPQRILCFQDILWTKEQYGQGKSIIIYLDKSAHVGQGDFVELSVGQEETIFHHEVCISFDLRRTVQPWQDKF